MKVTFKLTDQQALMAIAMKAKFAAEAANARAGYKVAFDGNLALVDDTGYGVRQQTMELSEDNSTITYGGMRTTLHEGCGDCIRTLRKISGGDLSKLEVVAYETTDHSMEWWETTADTLGRRSPEDLLRIKERARTGTYQNLQWQVKEAAERRSDKKLLQLIGEGNLTKISAGYTSKEIKEQKLLNACMAD